jgi:hypothetical protein
MNKGADDRLRPAWLESVLWRRRALRVNFSLLGGTSCPILNLWDGFIMPEKSNFKSALGREAARWRARRSIRGEMLDRNQAFFVSLPYVFIGCLRHRMKISVVETGERDYVPLRPLAASLRSYRFSRRLGGRSHAWQLEPRTLTGSVLGLRRTHRLPLGRLLAE